MIGRRHGRHQPSTTATAVRDEPPAQASATAGAATSETAGWVPAGATAVTPATPPARPADWVPGGIAPETPPPTSNANPGEWVPGEVPAPTPTHPATATLTPEAWLPDGDVEPIAPTRDFAALEPTPPPSRRFPFEKPLLRYGLPVAVVAVSLLVVLAIAGVFSHSGVTRPGITPLAPATVQPNGAVSPAAATPQVVHRKRAHKPVTHARTQPHKAAAPVVAAPAPAPRPAVPVTHTPVVATPAPVHHAPSPPQHAPPAPTSKTRPTQRSGAPGRQPISG